jgi:predicted RNA-binding protein with PUA domain
MNGHFWCDRCDEIAFGEICRQCHQAARWVPVTPPRFDRRPKPVAPEVAKELFRNLYNLVNQCKP